MKYVHATLLIFNGMYSSLYFYAVSENKYYQFTFEESDAVTIANILGAIGWVCQIADREEFYYWGSFAYTLPEEFTNMIVELDKLGTRDKW